MATKHTKIVRLAYAIGQPCPYCKRKMEMNSGTQPSRDHVHPQSRGGELTIWCCWDCNNRKGDMSLAEWREHTQQSAHELGMTLDQWRRYLESHALVAQGIEQPTSNQQVAGSIPAERTTN